LADTAANIQESAAIYKQRIVTNKTKTHSRIFGLDILRACAIMTVVIGHGTYLLPSNLSKICSHIFGYDGVSIFFVLSGFLIGGILIKTLEKKRGQKRVLLNFWIRRWFRTIPPYFLILTILLISHLLFAKGFSFSKNSPLNFFTFTQNLFYRHPDFFPEAWSLPIEEWFYLLIPPIILVFIFFKRSVKTSVLCTALSILIVITLFRFYRYSNIPVETLPDFSLEEWDLQFRKQVITRLDSLMFGMIGAFLQYYYREYWLKYKKTLLCLGVLLFVINKFFIDPSISIGSLYNCVFSFSVTSFATLLLLPFLSDFKTYKNGFIQKSITTISLISYSMYLVNLSLVQLLILNHIPWDIIPNRYIMGGTRYLLYWFLTISLSMTIYKYFEVPTMNLRDNKTIKKWLRI
jgi:peptidoglycan/LPS O-acetylase OafA/YrhL